MTRVFLAAGVAALAIAAPASAGPHGGGRGGGGGQPAFASQGGGGGQRQARQQQRPQRQPMAMQRMQRPQRFATAQRPQRAERQQAREQHAPARMAERRQARPTHAQQQRVAQRARPTHAQQRMAERQQAHAGHAQQQRMATRQQAHGNRAQAQNRQAQNRQQMHGNRAQQAQNMRGQQVKMQGRMANRQQLQINGRGGQQQMMAQRQQLRGQQQARNLLVQRRALTANSVADVGAFRASRLAAMAVTPRSPLIAPAEAVRFVGQPVNSVTNYVTLAALPRSVSYLYPDTPNYYYQYGDGYLYQVDRSTSLIDALIPLLAGGFLPGTYLPQPYMASYVPSYYGFNSFYPASYDYGYGYGNVCNRYAYGVVYQVDCYNGMVENVIPMYAGGYGVGQLLPSAYSYYNLPMQYRSMYYPTADYSYWYSPGAIYQYDPRSSLITSVAALMSPGFSIGQPLPAGYGMYNVPMAYRATYYDTPDAWYRYNNGYIYQINPATQLVTAIVASLLT